MQKEQAMQEIIERRHAAWKSLVSEQLTWILSQINDGIREGMSAAGIIENKLGLGPSEHKQDLRRELMVITDTFADAAEKREEWAKDREEQKEWLRKHCCPRCVGLINKGF